MQATSSILEDPIESLAARALASGAFAPDASRELPPRPDATAWAILALEANGGANPQLLGAARDWLAAEQLEDGRVSMTRDQPAAAWPTSLSILAWQGSPPHAEAQQRAVDFLLRFRGLAFARTPLLGHDTTLVGWPWIEATHSWVEPTALGLIALRVTGHEGHSRARRAAELLLDRQLDTGGWNYGNTTAFGQVQRPTPDSTGVALSALAGEDFEGDLDDEARSSAATPIESSLDYLEREVARVRTPLSLGWGLLGLSAWNRRPGEAVAWCRECLDRQAALGAFDTALLAAVLFAARASAGLFGSLRQGNGS